MRPLTPYEREALAEIADALRRAADDDDGPPFESAPPFPDPPGQRTVHHVQMGPPEVPEPYRFDESDLAPGFYDDADPADDAHE